MGLTTLLNFRAAPDNITKQGKRTCPLLEEGPPRERLCRFGFANTLFLETLPG